MKKKNILKNNSDFQRIINQKKSKISSNFVIYIEYTNQKDYHFGISVSKKLGNAVVRNKLKRQVKDIIDKKDYQNNFNCIIILRKAILSKNYDQIKKDLFAQLDKLNIYKEEQNVQK